MPAHSTMCKAAPLGTAAAAAAPLTFSASRKNFWTATKMAANTLMPVVARLMPVVVAGCTVQGIQSLRGQSGLVQPME